VTGVEHPGHPRHHDDHEHEHGPSRSTQPSIRGANVGRNWEPSSARKQLGRTAGKAGVRRRFAPHQLRHAHAVEMAHEGVPLVVIQRQLGHANLGVTSIYLQGIDSSEIIHTVHSRPAPVIRPLLASGRCSWSNTGG